METVECFQCVHCRHYFAAAEGSCPFCYVTDIAQDIEKKLEASMGQCHQLHQAVRGLTQTRDEYIHLCDDLKAIRDSKGKVDPLSLRTKEGRITYQVVSWFIKERDSALNNTLFQPQKVNQ